MLLEGQISLPRGGIGRISEQLAEGLAVGFETRVTGLEPHNEGVGVQTTRERLEATHVIVATDPPELNRLTGVGVPTESVGSNLSLLRFTCAFRRRTAPALKRRQGLCQ